MVREVDFYYQPASSSSSRNSVTSLKVFLPRQCFKTSRVCNERKLDCICTLKKIYFLYSCLTSILTNSYLQKFCILTSGPSLIIRVVRFIAIRALKIMYFLLLQYSESEMFCYTEVVKMSWYCLHIAAPLVDSQSCSTSVIGGSFEAQLLKFYDENLPFLPFFTAYECMNKKNRNLLSNQGQIRSCPQFPSLCHIP